MDDATLRLTLEHLAAAPPAPSSDSEGGSEASESGSDTGTDSSGGASPAVLTPVPPSEWSDSTGPPHEDITGSEIVSSDKGSGASAPAAISFDPVRGILDVSWRSFPRPPNRLNGVDIAGGEGGVFVFLTPMVVYFHTLTEMVEEKERRVRLGMHMQGLRAPAFWAVRAGYTVVVCGLSSVIQVAAGYACGFDVFTNANPTVVRTQAREAPPSPLVPPAHLHSSQRPQTAGMIPCVNTLPCPTAHTPISLQVWLIFFQFGVAMSAFGMLQSVFIRSSASAQTAAYATILLGFVLQCILSTSWGIMINLLLMRSDLVPGWLKVTRRVLSLWCAARRATAHSALIA